MKIMDIAFFGKEILGKLSNSITRNEPLIADGNIIPQYWRQFRLTIPTTLAEGIFPSIRGFFTSISSSSLSSSLSTASFISISSTSRNLKKLKLKM